MYTADNFKKADEETFILKISPDRDFKILQLTDLHLGFGLFSKKRDQLALKAVSTIVKKTKPDLIAITGDSVFPFFPKAGTLNNKRQAQIFIRFMDQFRIPYAMVFGNHDCEMFSRYNKEKMAELFASGKYSIFTKGRPEIYGVGNYFLNLTDEQGRVLLPLVFLDSNMYGDPDVKAMAFFHIPVAEFKEAYEKMRLGDKSVTYMHGNIGEVNDHFGIPGNEGTFFRKAVENGVIKWMFCGHDHLNTLSVVYKGIRMTYGMSIDYLGYNGILKRHTQRGGTLITRHPDGSVEIRMVPLNER